MFLSFRAVYLELVLVQSTEIEIVNLKHVFVQGTCALRFEIDNVKLVQVKRIALQSCYHNTRNGARLVSSKTSFSARFKL